MRLIATLRLLLILAAILLYPSHPAIAQDADQVRAAIRELLSTRSQHSPLAPLRRFTDWSSLGRFYAAADYAPHWLAAERPHPLAEQAVGILLHADSHGLIPADYDGEWLAERLHAIADAQPASAEALAMLDVALTNAVLRMLADLHAGRVSPQDVHADLDLAPRQLDLPELLRAAIAAGRIDAATAGAAPRYPMYERLREALARYRTLAASGVQRALPVVSKLEPGMSYAGLTQLRQMLVALGDLPASAIAHPRYEGDLVGAVKRFQERHGLDPDGIIGAATFEQLNTPLAQRVRQIELALERMRWIPDFAAAKIIGINIPEFRLRAIDVLPGGMRVRLSMKVIVGRALETPTPLFDEDMRYVEFSPYWNVPSSIALGEILPKLRRDPRYLQRQEMELVAHDSEPQDAVTSASLDALARGELRLRQRPGPKNALGGIKFVLPNAMSIYLHHTPATALFKRSRRDFSHGCIRVEDPLQLARFVLEDQPEWTEERIRNAMQAGIPSRAHLRRPVPVVIFYLTALVGEGGRVVFLRDIYGHDDALDRALAARGLGSR